MTEEHHLRKEIVDFLVDLSALQEPNGRRAVLLNSGLDEILRHVDCTGTPYEFVTRTVTELYEYGNLPGGQPALDAWLQGTENLVGRDKRAKIETLRERLRIHLAKEETFQEAISSPVFHAVDFKQEDIFSYYSTFVGRQKETDAVREFLQSDGGEYLLIQGKAGMGKTALVAELARQGADNALGMPVSCVVFFIREEGGCNTPERYLDALNHQILKLLGEYDEISIHLAEKRRQYDRLWEKIVTRVSPSNRLFVLIDGLDESTRNGKQPLAEYLPATIPPYIYWLVTSRPLPDMLDAIPTTHVLRKARSHWLSGLSSREVRELLALNGDRIEHSDNFIARLIAHTNGEPLFLRFLCQDIANKTEIDAETYLKETPRNVSMYFQQQFQFLWKRTEYAGNRKLIMDILTTLLISFSGLTVKELSGILQRKPFEIRECITLFERFLLGEASYALMHLEFRRTIEEELVREEDKQEALDAILAYCERSWAKDDPQERYAIRYYLRHLWACQRYRKVLTLCEAGYLDLKLRRLISPELMEADYQFLYDVCQKEGDVMTLVRWGLHRAKIADKAAALRDIKTLPEAIGTVAQRGRHDWWERGVGLCALIPGISGKIQGLLGLCKGLEPERSKAPENVFERIEALLGEIPPSANRDSLIGEYVQELCRWGVTYVHQALEAVSRIENKGGRCRSQALAAIAYGYALVGKIEAAAEVLGYVLETAVRITDDRDRFEVLSAVAQGYAQVRNVETAVDGLGHVLEATVQIGDEGFRSQALSAVAQGYAQIEDVERATDGLGHVLEATDQIGNEWTRSQTLSAVAQDYAWMGDVETATKVLGHALETAIRIENELFRSQALSAVAQSYARVGDIVTATKVLDHVLAAARIEDEAIRFQIFSAVAQVYARVGDVVTAADGLRHVLEVTAQIGNEWARSQVLFAVVESYAYMGNAEAAADGLRHILESATWIEHEGLRSKALSVISEVYARVGDVAITVDGLRYVLEVAGWIGGEWRRSEALSAVAQGYVQVGDVKTAAMVIDHALKAANRIEHEWRRFHALSAVAQVYAQIGDVKTAAVLGHALETAVRIGNEVFRSKALTTVAEGYAQMGEIETAATVLDRVLEVAVQIEHASERSSVLSALAQGYARLGHVEAARGGLGYVLEAVVQIRHVLSGLFALSAVAQGYAQVGEIETAIAVLDHAMKAAARINDEEEYRSFALSTVAQGYAQVGEMETAVAVLDQAVKAAARIGDKKHYPSTVSAGHSSVRGIKILTKNYEEHRSFALSAAAQGYAQVGDVETAAGILGQAREIAARIGYEESHYRAFSAVAQGYAHVMKIPKACDLLASIFRDADFLETCKAIFARVESLSEDNASDVLLDTLYHVLPLASQHSRLLYLQVVQHALPALGKHLPPGQVRPILAFLEEQWRSAAPTV